MDSHDLPRTTSNKDTRFLPPCKNKNVHSNRKGRTRCYPGDGWRCLTRLQLHQISHPSTVASRGLQLQGGESFLASRVTGSLHNSKLQTRQVAASKENQSWFCCCSSQEHELTGCTHVCMERDLASCCPWRWRCCGCFLEKKGTQLQVLPGGCSSRMEGASRCTCGRGREARLLWQRKEHPREVLLFQPVADEGMEMTIIKNLQKSLLSPIKVTRFSFYNTPLA